MAAVPLQMIADGFSFSQSSLTVQLHMVAMFAPSFVTGHAIKRFGGPPLMAVGALLMAGGCVIARLSGSEAGFISSLALIGLGWNLCFVPATAGLGKQSRLRERARVQAVNDVLVFSTGGACAILAAPALEGLGWTSMQVVGYVLSGAILLAVLVSEGLESHRTHSRTRQGAHQAGSPVEVVTSSSCEQAFPSEPQFEVAPHEVLTK